MKRYIPIILTLLLASACTQTTSYVGRSQHQNIQEKLSMMGVESDVIADDIDNITEDVVGILSDNFSLDDTFVVAGDMNANVYGVLVPKMRQAGLKVVTKSGLTDKHPEYHPLDYTFTVTDNHMVATDDIALLRVWVGNNFQISKAFTYSPEGLKSKTAYSVLGRN
jgi:hypothetical protein